jgi:hypothetical protein
MTKRRIMKTWTRGLQAMITVSCLLVVSCAAEIMDVGAPTQEDGAVAGDSDDMSAGDEATSAQDMRGEPLSACLSDGQS